MSYQNGYNAGGFGPPQAFAGAPHVQQPPQQQQHPHIQGLPTQQAAAAAHAQQQHQLAQQHQQQQIYAASQVAHGQLPYGHGAPGPGPPPPPMGPGMPMGAGPMAPGGPMMHAGMQQQMGAHHSPYTNAPYPPQPTAAPAASSMPGQYAGYRTSLTPPRQDSPQTPQQAQNARHMAGPGQVLPPPQPQASGQPITPPNRPQSQAQAQSQANARQQQQQQQQQQQPPQPPQSPAAREREKERISLLLMINGELLQEVVRLQKDGKAGMPDQAAGQAKDEAKEEKEGVDGEPQKPKKAPHPDYIECMRRLQANLAYLAAIADRAHKPASHIPMAPAIMGAPEKMPGLAETYRQLAALFAEAPAPGKEAGKLP